MRADGARRRGAAQGVVNSLMSQPVFAGERAVYYRERAAGMYAALPFSLSLVRSVPHPRACSPTASPAPHEPDACRSACQHTAPESQRPYHDFMVRIFLPM